MLANRQTTDTQTDRQTDRNTLLPYLGGVTMHYRVGWLVDSFKHTLNICISSLVEMVQNEHNLCVEATEE